MPLPQIQRQNCCPLEILVHYKFSFPKDRGGGGVAKRGPFWLQMSEINEKIPLRMGVNVLLGSFASNYVQKQ